MTENLPIDTTHSLSIKALLIEDNPLDVRLIREFLVEAGAREVILESADQLTTGLDRVTRGEIDVVLLDLSLPDSQGLDTFLRAHAHAPSLPIIVLTGLNDEDLGIQAVQSGAQDYLLKARVNGHLLVRSIRYAIERKRFETHLRYIERLAELGTLAAGMAHEIGTPMNVILGRAEYLLRKTSDESAKKGLEIIVTQVERITKIMNQLLTFAMQRPLERGPVELTRVLGQILDLVEDQIMKNGVKVETTIAPNVPKVLGDSDQLQQVLLNLVLNAVYAMPEGGKLNIGVDQVDAHVKLTVKDTGQGISPETLPRIFDPFFTTKPTGEGTGLGLAVVQSIIQEHGGTIRVESQPGQGTMFSVLLPCEQSGVEGGGVRSEE